MRYSFQYVDQHCWINWAFVFKLLFVLQSVQLHRCNLEVSGKVREPDADWNEANLFVFSRPIFPEITAG